MITTMKPTQNRPAKMPGILAVLEIGFLQCGQFIECSLCAFLDELAQRLVSLCYGLLTF